MEGIVFRGGELLLARLERVDRLVTHVEVVLNGKREFGRSEVEEEGERWEGGRKFQVVLQRPRHRKKKHLFSFSQSNALFVSLSSAFFLSSSSSYYITLSSF